jgi:putative N6-adenine-specific DNA methylase
VHFEVRPDAFLALHLWLRTPGRLVRVERDCAAATPEMLFDQARRVPWPDLFDAERTFKVDAVALEGRQAAIPREEVTRRVREAVAQSFARRGGAVPRVDLEDPKVTVVAVAGHGRALLGLDTSGKSLDKRGYRMEGHPAPLKETLAAAVLRLAGYDGSRPLLDPMCGSGTLAIEAATIALRKPPLIHRGRGEFGFEWLKGFDAGAWRRVQEEARAVRLPLPPQPVFASDADARYVELARRHALRARVERDIRFQAARFQDLAAPSPSGLVVANLPYGERLGSGEDLKRLYVEIGDTLKRSFQGWDAALLVADDSPWKFIGLRPHRKIPLLNGAIPARLLLYEIRPWKPRDPL